MNILIAGPPNSGKSQFRRWLVAELRKAGQRAEHWDADKFPKVRCPEDKDMKEPDNDRLTIWLIEDVRFSLPYNKATKRGEKSAWKPIHYYSTVIYLKPSWPTYAAFWVSRALQWKKLGKGNYMREAGWENMAEEEVIERKVQYYLNGMEEWVRDDEIFICHNHKQCFQVKPVIRDGKIEWQMRNQLVQTIAEYHAITLALSEDDYEPGKLP